MDMFYVRVPRDREAEAEHAAVATPEVTFDRRSDGFYLGAPLDQNRALSRAARLVLAKFDERISTPRPRDAKGKLIKAKRAKKRSKAKAAPPPAPKPKPKAKRLAISKKK